MLPKESRLRGSRDFQRVKRQGRSFAHPLLVLFSAPREQPGVQVGISVSRAVGNAVVRNRTRRRLRQAARTLLPRLARGYDLVLIARPAAADAGAAALEEALKGLAGRAGLLGGDEHKG